MIWKRKKKNSYELKLCPFCGGEAMFSSELINSSGCSYWCVECTSCTALVTATSQPVVASYWNNRVITNNEQCISDYTVLNSIIKKAISLVNSDIYIIIGKHGKIEIWDNMNKTSSREYPITAFKELGFVEDLIKALNKMISKV